MSRWVVDASPLIFLAKLDRLQLLARSAGEVLVPPAVLDEIGRYDDLAAAKIRESAASWLRTVAPEDLAALEVLEAEVGGGEAAAITLAREIRAERIVVDDLDARRHARRLGLRPVGTLGLLLAARLKGEIESVRTELERLRGHGFRASDKLVAAVLSAAGE
jgi:predicted nucleic acid-binding protein